MKTKNITDKYIYYCYKTDERIKIDGILNEKIWAKTKCVGSFLFPWGKKGDLKQTTAAKLLWDNKYLYVGFFANDKDIVAINRGVKGRVWKDDVVEIFINPDPKRNVYYGFETNALGFLYDFKEHYKVKTYRDWTAKGIKVATYIKKDRYFSAELAIPFSCFKKHPKDNTIWKAGIYRIDYNKGRNPEYSVWKSPCSKYPAYHRLKGFGYIVFKE